MFIDDPIARRNEMHTHIEWDLVTGSSGLDDETADRVAGIDDLESALFFHLGRDFRDLGADARKQVIAKFVEKVEIYASGVEISTTDSSISIAHINIDEFKDAVIDVAIELLDPDSGGHNARAAMDAVISSA